MFDLKLLKDFLPFYLLAINIVTFIIFAADKSKAKRRARRIKESTLFILSILGGSIGALLAMYIFRHKTKKPAFVFGMPLLLFAQLVLIFYSNFFR